MSFVFAPIFVAPTKIIFVYNFVAPLMPAFILDALTERHEYNQLRFSVACFIKFEKQESPVS